MFLNNNAYLCDMKKLKLFTITAFVWLFSAIAADKCFASNSAVTDTIRFTASSMLLEDNPNQNNYNFTLYSPDGEWKVQLNYNAESMFGTFTSEDFDLTGNGKNYNYARNPKNDMMFYSFVDIVCTVSASTTEYYLTANCLTSNNKRFLIEGTMEAPIPTDSVEIDLGYAKAICNNFYETFTFKAENENYKLEYGIVSQRIDGTFYTADLLKPELFDKNANSDIEIVRGTAYHRISNDTTYLTLHALDNHKKLYKINMYNCARVVDVTAEDSIYFHSNTMLQDLTELYGCYQLAAINDEWAVSIALLPDAFENGTKSWSMEDIFMPYTMLIHLSDEKTLDLCNVNVRMEEENEPYLYAFYSDILTDDGTLYHVKMRFEDTPYIPAARDTVNINFGTISVLDYSKGSGIVGLGAIRPNKYQLRLYLYTDVLEGNYTSDYLVTDHSDLLLIDESTLKFRDIVRANTYITETDGTKYVIADVLTTDTILYHTKMIIPNLKCMNDTTIDLSNAQMVAIQSVNQEINEKEYSEYRLQFQNTSNVAFQQVFSFYFPHEGKGIAGEYGYSAGTLATDEYHTFIESNIEVRVGAIAGTLNFTPVESLTLKSGYKTTIYDTHFQFLGQNGAIYTADAHQYLICVDNEGNKVNMEEPELSDLNQIIEERGWKVKKMLKNGIFIIDSQYNLDGTAIK